ncbi:MAG: hypothetical protein KJ697_03175 [Nanoarchaeota archaeon]|nr:hypothetical protein [Nanoarchaeota archaeon]
MVEMKSTEVKVLQTLSIGNTDLLILHKLSGSKGHPLTTVSRLYEHKFVKNEGDSYSITEDGKKALGEFEKTGQYIY